jgi:hypothetical protein
MVLIGTPKNCGVIYARYRPHLLNVASAKGVSSGVNARALCSDDVARQKATISNGDRNDGVVCSATSGTSEGSLLTGINNTRRAFACQVQARSIFACRDTC